MEEKRMMTTLEAYAQHGSTSYKPINPLRFAEILRGDIPTKSEKVSVCQGLTEMHASAISGEHADYLAKDVSMTRPALEARCQQLCGCALGELAFPEQLPQLPRMTSKK
ncbi:MAG: hypothetical protein AB8B51_15375 [Sedimentitalea sp.]